MAEGCEETRVELQGPDSTLGCCVPCYTILLGFQSSSNMLAWGRKEILAGFSQARGCNSLDPSCAAHSFPWSFGTGSFFLLALDPLWVIAQTENRAAAPEKDPRRGPQYSCSLPQARPQELGHLALHTWWGLDLPTPAFCS